MKNLTTKFSSFVYNSINENILPKPYKKIKCLECGESVCDNLNYKIAHLYNKHNCKPSLNDYKAKNMLKQYFSLNKNESKHQNNDKINESMNLEDFRKKWFKEIEEGIVEIIDNGNCIIADRFNGENFLCTRDHINKIQSDLKRMGYNRLTIGTYVKEDPYKYVSNITGNAKDLLYNRLGM